MPLTKSKSKEAFSSNVKAEMDAGKPQKQALAIAYSVARKAANGGGVRVNGKLVSPSIGGVMSKKPWKGYKSGGAAKADGGPTDDIFNSSDSGAMSPETFVNPYVKQKISALASIPQRAIEGSAQDMQHLGEEGYDKQSVGPAVETALQGLGNAGIRPTPGVSGVFVGPHGASMLRDEAAAAGKPMMAHPVVADAIKPELKGTSPKFRREAEGVQQELMDNVAADVLPQRGLTGDLTDRDVFAQTGWSRGADAKIRKEIPDTGAKLEQIPGTDKYELKHPAGDFHKIYDLPPVEKIPNDVKKAFGSKKLDAAYDKEKNVIYVDNPKDPNAASFVLHELQHAIQKKEGFAQGSNTFAAKERPEVEHELFPALGPGGEKGFAVPSWQNKGKPGKFLDTSKSLMGPDQIKDYAAARTYQRASGEVEARNVQDRFEKNLYKKHPEDTEDITRGLQWRKSGGRTKMADGGLPPPPWFVRAEARGSSGMLKSAIPGRTDKIPLNVPGGAYVLPADIPSALGQGNTMAGGSILDKMFSKGPYGMNIAKAHSGQPKMRRLSSLSKVSKLGFADGGDAGTAKIIAAGGEYIIHPDQVRAIGGGDIDKGHKILDAFVKHVRDKHIKTLKGLPGPKTN
jgi:hypothetical protein